MLPGPDLIIKCPSCKAPYLKQTLMSGNTFGGVCFSAGQHFYPMLPDFPQITHCDACGNFFWLNDMNGEEFLAGVDGDPEPPFIRWLNDYEYEDAIRSGIFRDPKEEAYLRMQLWWIMNNKMGKKSQGAENGQPLPAGHYDDNLLALLRLKEAEKPADTLMLAEIHRELGHFDKALEILKKVSDDRLKPIARQIMEKAGQHDRRAFRLV
jgi:hypothetical protein